MPFNDATIGRQMDEDTFRRAFMARLKAAQVTGEKLVEEHRFKTAEVLLSAGLTLIPSEHLQDHQFVVSQGIYDAAMKIAKSGG